MMRFPIGGWNLADASTAGPVTIQQDWLAWLPEEKRTLFQSMLGDLEVSYTILSVALNDAFTICSQGKLPLAREQAAMFAGLFDRLVGKLHGILRTLDEHGRHFGTNVQVAPLRVDLFRTEQAQAVARANHLLSLVSLRRPGRFFRKLASLDQLLAKLQKQVRLITTEIMDGASLSLPGQWTQLEGLHHDLNTCFCETTIVLKSFFCALPDAELLPFRTRLLSMAPAAVADDPGRAARFANKMTIAGESDLETRQASAAAAEDPAKARRRGQLHN